MQEYVWLLSSVYTCRCINLIWHFFGLPVSNNTIIGSFRNHDNNRDKNVTNLDIWQWKTIVLHALHVHFSFLDISLTFSFFPRRETVNDLFCTCAGDVSILWQMFNLAFLSLKLCFQCNSRIVRLHFASKMTLNNWEMIARLTPRQSGLHLN